jgi:quercetin dioxygenase-like cupin family protein
MLPFEPMHGAAEIVLPARDLDATVAFFTERGFALESISPAESPRVAVLAGLGIRLRFDIDARTHPGEIVIWSDRTEDVTAPNGTRVVARVRSVELPPLAPSFVLTKNDGSSSWSHGRAGMRYRDLVPDRQGGRFVASHIRVGEGGPVADYVHFHRIRFQLIYCYRGWVRLVYEGQGPPFVMHAGECVLQPPEIRHRVLECAEGTEVIEVGSPALSETVADPSMDLPNAVSDRRFGGQSFVRHELTNARWERSSSFLVRDLGIAEATNGLVRARVLRPDASLSADLRSHDGELLFSFVLDGRARLACEGRSADEVGAGDAFVVPAGMPFALEDRSSDLEVFELVVG